MRRSARRIAAKLRDLSARRQPRRLVVEPLESRRLLVGQGEVFSISETVDASGLLGDVSAQIRWGDDTSSAANSVVGGNQTGDLRIEFDYSLDDNDFFDSQERRDLLQIAADSLISRMTDDLAAIVPTSVHQWNVSVMHPSAQPTGDDEFVSYPLPSGPAVPENTIIVFAGSRDLGDSARGVGGPAVSVGIDPISFECEIQADCDQQLADFEVFRDTVVSRGNPGGFTDPPTDFAPGVGSISFDDTGTNWYFDVDASGFPAGDQIDFLTVATHELAHVLGFGVSVPWQQLVSGGSYTGPAGIDAYQGAGNVPLQPVISGTPTHWNQSVLDLQTSLMTGSLEFTAGDRTEFSSLDFAGLKDIGWEVVDMEATVTGQHQYLASGEFTPQIVLTGSIAGEIVQTLTPVTVTAVTQTLVAAFSDSEVGEDSATGVNLTLQRGDADVSNELIVTVTGGPSGQLDMPSTIRIPRNMSQHTVQVLPVNDNQAELTKNLSFTFTAANHETAIAVISVLDDEPPLFQNPIDRFDVAQNDGATASDALRIINELMRRGGEAILDPEIEQPDEVFYDVNGDYRISALDALNVINDLPNRVSTREAPVAALASLNTAAERVRSDLDDDELIAQLF